MSNPYPACSSNDHSYKPAIPRKIIHAYGNCTSIAYYQKPVKRVIPSNLDNKYIHVAVVNKEPRVDNVYRAKYTSKIVGF